MYVLIGRIAARNTAPLPCPRLFTRRNISTGLIVLDILAWAVQTGGIVMATKPHAAKATISRGVHVYMAGISAQLVFVLISCIMLYILCRAQAKREDGFSITQDSWLLYTVLALISARIVSRLVGYSGGIKAHFARGELYMYCLDSLPVFIALFLFNVFHPGRHDPGKVVHGKDISDKDAFQSESEEEIAHV